MREYLAIEPALKSFLSQADELTVSKWFNAGELSDVGWKGPDLTGMAAWAMHYLVCNPQPLRDYECRFHIWPLSLPPGTGDDEHDDIAPGDTESRMELEFGYMREMTGFDVGGDVEERIRARLLSYVRDDGLVWCSPRAGCVPADGNEPAASPWSTAILLRSTLEHYVRTQDEQYLELANKLVEGLMSLASSCGNLMWYEGGMAWCRDGKWLEGCSLHYPSILDAVCMHWLVTGDEGVLEFAEAMAEGIMAGVQKTLKTNRILPDGSHQSPNVHLTMRAVLGVAMVGQAADNARFIEWAKRAYEHTVANGTDWGWYPENLHVHGRYRSETCGTGDMVELAIVLAEAGYEEYWDHVERAVRNYLPMAQFFVTPEYEKLYRSIHAEKPAEDVQAALTLLRKYEGGFLARQNPNDWVFGKEWGGCDMNMMGCCPPEGMRSIYLAWSNTVVDTGDCVYVNMALDRDAQAATVRTHSPHTGKLEVTAGKEADFHIRPPAWAPQDQVVAKHNGNVIEADWYRNYVRFVGVSEGDTLTLEYPQPQFTQRVAVGEEGKESVYQAHWIGNDVVDITPRGEHLPIFTGARQPLRPLSDPAGWKAQAEATVKTSKCVSNDEDWDPNV